MNVVLFACVHNAGRSQMAAAWFNRLADPAKARAISAGTDPGSRVHPEVIDAMNEVGVNLSKAGTTRLTTEVAQQAQMLITMGCGDQCPVVPGVRPTIGHWKTRRASPSRRSARFVTIFVNASKHCSSTRGGLPPRAS